MARSRILVLVAAVLFSTGGAAIKACELSAWQVASFRSGIAMIAVWILLGARSSPWSYRTLLTAVAYSTTMVLFVTANKLTTAASTIFLQSTAPLYMVLFAHFVLKEPVRRRDLGLLAALGIGMALLVQDVGARASTAPDPGLGNLLAAASGVSWALTVGGLRWLESGARTPNASSGALVLGNALAFLVCLPAASPVSTIRPIDWALVAWLGGFQVALAYLCLARGVRKVPGLEAAFLLLLEPVLNPVWAWLVHREMPGVSSILGGALILGSTSVKLWLDARALRRPEFRGP